MNVTHRLNEFIEYKKLNAHSFEIAVGLTKNVIQKPLKEGTGITMKTLGKISEKFPELNTNWLLTGKGVMLMGEVFQEKGITLNSGCEEWKDKYYNLLEKYNNCLEERAKYFKTNLITN